jgi:ribose transport system substrate-binding protein
MRNTTIAFLCLTCLAGVAGCGPGSQGGGDDSGKLQIAVIPKCTSSEFWETVEEGAREAGRDLDVEVHWDGTHTETQIAEQNNLISNMVSLEKDGIAVAPLNRQATRKAVEAAVEAGIPVVIFDSAVDGDAHRSFVATDNQQGGALAAEHMIDLLGEGPTDLVVFRYLQGTASTESRAEGFIGVATDAGLKVLAQPYPEDGSVAGCKKTALNTLEQFIKDNQLQLDGIFACNDRSSMGMVAALEDIRKSGVEVDVKCIGFDFPPKLVAALQEEKLHALIAQDPRRMGYLAVETLVKHLRGEDVPEFIDTGVKLVTRERLAADAELRRLVGVKE